MQSISWTGEVKEAADLYERTLEAEGMPAELPEEFPCVASVEEVGGAGLGSDEHEADNGRFRAHAGAELSPEDRVVVERIKAAGWAATLEEAGADRGQVESLADSGIAHLRACGKKVVLAMAGATEGDVRQAAARAQALEAGTREPQAQELTPEELSPEAVTVEILRYVARRGGAVEERALETSLRGRSPRLREAALALLAERGKVRRLRCRSSGKTLVVLANAPKAAASRELRRVADLEAALEEERREAMKPHASEVERVGGKAVADWLVKFRRAVAGKELKSGQVRELIRTELPFRIGLMDALGEDAEIAEWRRSYARRREENAGIIRRAIEESLVLGRSGAPPESRWTDDPGLRRRIGAQLRTGRAAYNTARAVYLASLPTLAHKVLHLLKRDGRQPQEWFLALAAAEAAGREDPEALLDGAIRALGEAGKIRRLCSRTTGEIHLEATEGLDEAAFERSLRRIISSGRHGIPVPGGWKPDGDPRPDPGTGMLGHSPKPASRRPSGRLAIPS